MKVRGRIVTTKGAKINKSDRLPGLPPFLFLIFAICFNPLPAAAQAAAFNQIPQRLYVGDRGRLVVTLGPGFQGIPAFVIEDIRQLPQGQDLKIHRLEFDHLRGRERLHIDFTAFVPGQMELPLINLPQLPGLTLEGYHVTIASILGPADSLLVLSNPAPPLTVPGTALLIYGTSSLIVLALLVILGISIWGRPYLAELLEAHRRRRLIRLMRNIGKRLRGKISDGAYQEILRELSAEFRAFLGYFSGLDCRAMTASEFYFLPPLFSLETAAPAGADLISPSSLGNYFRLMDRLRFSGKPVNGVEISSLLDRLDAMLIAMELCLREQRRRKPEPPAGVRRTEGSLFPAKGAAL
jgi:hypothetical protein